MCSVSAAIDALDRERDRLKWVVVTQILHRIDAIDTLTIQDRFEVYREMGVQPNLMDIEEARDGALQVALTSTLGCYSAVLRSINDLKTWVRIRQG